MHLFTSSAAGRELHDVDLHGNHKLHIVCTSKGEDVDKMLSTLRRKLGGMPVKLVGVDVEYTHYVKPQRAAVRFSKSSSGLPT